MTDTIKAKVDHVISAPNNKNHHCHWPGCTKQVKPAFWGCTKHWYSLPPALRAKVWQTYEIGQEQRQNPSEDYLTVIDEIQAYIKQSPTRT